MLDTNLIKAIADGDVTQDSSPNWREEGDTFGYRPNTDMSKAIAGPSSAPTPPRHLRHKRDAAGNIIGTCRCDGPHDDE